MEMRSVEKQSLSGFNPSPRQLEASGSSATPPSRRRSRTLALPILVLLLTLISITRFSPSYDLHKTGHGYSLLSWRQSLFQSRPHTRGVKGYLRAVRSWGLMGSLENKGLVMENGGQGSVWPHWPKRLTPKEAQDLFLTIPSNDSARAASHSFTALPHIAGTSEDRLSALRVKSQWEALLNLPASEPESNILESGTEESREMLMGKKEKKGWQKWVREGRKMVGLGRERMGRVKEMKQNLWPWTEKPRVWVDTYYPLLNYPISSSVSLHAPNSSTVFTATLLENSHAKDSTSSRPLQAFHGLSANGSASGKLVYAGRGTHSDFDKLKEAGVDVKGKIALVQYGGAFRGLKVKEAGENGCVGILIYTDPIEDGEVTVENGYMSYPDGPAREPSSVQRGSTQYLSIYPGDPLTPFYPAYQNSTHRLERTDHKINIPSIPSLPISYEDALPLLLSLNGKGMKADKLDWGRGGDWKEGGLGYRGVEYWTGPGEEEVRMDNIMDDKVTPIWNTMAVIPGHIKDEIVVLGNHNDAWTYGAGDPNSGTASVHEIVKGLGVLLEKGWKPLRTIVLASWDAEEYGLIGSTEFGEDFSHWLKENVVAYLNVDVAVAGTAYSIGASPSLSDLFKEVSEKVEDPDEPGKNLAAKVKHVGALGSGSDFTVFLQHLGIASANIGYGRKSTDPVYHYHSIYDSAYWQDQYGDPTFNRHTAIANVLGLATLRLTDDLILPINITTYAFELTSYVTKVKSLGYNLTYTALDKSVENLQLAAVALENEIVEVEEGLQKGGVCMISLLKKVRGINKRLSKFEGGFINEGGLPGREWYRNLVVSPGRYLGYGATTLPALTESLTLDKKPSQAEMEIKRLIVAFNGVTRMLLQA